MFVRSAARDRSIALDIVGHHPAGIARIRPSFMTDGFARASGDASMRLVGLLITKDDDAIIGEWCAAQLRLYDAVVCLDGSAGDATARQLCGLGDRVVYLHERDSDIPYKTDHGLRRIAHQEIVRRFGTDNWVMCCHADEFCYHDPRKVAKRAEAEGFDQVSWYSLHFYPHPDELPTDTHLGGGSIRTRFRHYHWDYRSTGHPWVEDRLYRNGPQVWWDHVTHGSVRPHGLSRPAPFRPALCHYKVVTFDLASYESAGRSTHYRTHWAGLEHRTGLPFPIKRPEDLFVAHVPGYARCDRFDGTFPHAWNIGEAYRPDAEMAGPRTGTSQAE
jgi:hypothetical protein